MKCNKHEQYSQKEFAAMQGHPHLDDIISNTLFGQSYLSNHVQKHQIWIQV